MDFGTALKDWRTRRRISQLDLALRAGTTQRHVSFMENGRSVPGRGMVLRVAESLELPLRERNGLLHAAGYAPTYPETRLTTRRSGRCSTACAGCSTATGPTPQSSSTGTACWSLRTARSVC